MPDYIPHTLIVTVKPEPGTYEFLVTWKDTERDAYPLILGVFTRHMVRLLLTHTQPDEDSKSMVAVVYCDITRADISVQSLKDELEILKPVSRVEFVSTHEAMFEKYLFPIVSRGNRWLIMRVRTLLNIENSIREKLGTGGSSLMFEEGVATGFEGSSYPGGVLSQSEKGELLRNTSDGLRACGWGVFDFKSVDDGFMVTIDDPPLLEGVPEPSRFICGLAAGVLKSAYISDFKVDDISFDPKTGRVTMRLSEIKPESGRKAS
jgi:hypothetical protein